MNKQTQNDNLSKYKIRLSKYRYSTKYDLGAAFVSDFVSGIIYARTVVGGTGVPCGDAGAIDDCVPNWLQMALLVPQVDAEMASVNLTVMSSAAIASLPDNFEVTAACPVGVGTLWKAMILALALGLWFKDEPLCLG
jgi:hypothetical protein